MKLGFLGYTACGVVLCRAENGLVRALTAGQSASP